MTEAVKSLVTFALFAYNQEEFVEEAVLAAFSQTYEPLEIILSDDCSSDNTYQIMQTMAENYRGPHKVHARRNVSNSGTFNHVLQVVECSGGELFILAAGDDISYPERVSKTVAMWQATGAWGMSSHYDFISESGLVFEKNRSSEGGKEIKKWFGAEAVNKFVHGATSAYDRRLFQDLPLADQPIFNEDALLSAMVLLKKQKIVTLDEPLVGYRQHSAALSNNRRNQVSRDDVIGFERKISFFAKAYVALCDYVISQYRSHSSQIPGFEDRVNDTRRACIIQSVWIEASFFQRLNLVFMCRSFKELKLLLPRMLGLSVFSSVKARLKSSQVERLS